MSLFEVFLVKHFGRGFDAATSTINPGNDFENWHLRVGGPKLQVPGFMMGVIGIRQSVNREILGDSLAKWLVITANDNANQREMALAA